MVLYVAPYILDTGASVRLVNMLTLQLGEFESNDILELAPPILVASYTFADDNIDCPPSGWTTRFVDISLNGASYRYTVPFPGGSFNYGVLLDQLRAADPGTTWEFRGERYSRYFIETSLGI